MWWYWYCIQGWCRAFRSKLIINQEWPLSNASQRYYKVDKMCRIIQLFFCLKLRSSISFSLDYDNTVLASKKCSVQDIYLLHRHKGVYYLWTKCFFLLLVMSYERDSACVRVLIVHQLLWMTPIQAFFFFFFVNIFLHIAISFLLLSSSICYWFYSI